MPETSIQANSVVFRRLPRLSTIKADPTDDTLKPAQVCAEASSRKETLAIRVPERVNDF